MRVSPAVSSGYTASSFTGGINTSTKNTCVPLENKSTAPHQKRQPQFPRELAEKVRELRKANPACSGKKLRPVLVRSREAVASAAALGRLIVRERLFFRADVSRRKKKQPPPYNPSTIEKTLSFEAAGVRTVAEFDMKHICLPGMKHYAFCAIDAAAREAAVHIGRSRSGRNARTALEKAVSRFGKNIVIVCDNGSENIKEAEEYPGEQGITQYRARPHAPKEKPCVERFIGTLQKECPDYHYEPMNAAETAEAVNAWLDKYHFYRPDEVPGFLTPGQYCAAAGLSIPHTGVSFLY